MQPALEQLEAVLGHAFRRKDLLEQALTHSSLAYERAMETTGQAAASFAERRQTRRAAKTAAVEAPASPAHEQAPPRDNEQLEFLGDAVIGLVVAQALYERYPLLQEGDLTRLRAHLVSRKHLGHVALRLDLGAWMRLGRGEERSGGRRKAALLANCMEAVIAALYLDGAPGLDVVRPFIEREVIAPHVDDLHRELSAGNSIGDHKSALQEFLQAHRHAQPEYVVKAESGPDHRKSFLVEVRIAGEDRRTRALARGVGTTKKKAEQEAARRAVEKLRQAEDRKARDEEPSDAEAGAAARGGERAAMQAEEAGS
jgi:ribonuclease-3